MTRAVSLGVAWLLAVALVGPARSPARAGGIEEHEEEIIALVEKLSPSVVRVHAVVKGPFGADRRVCVSGIVLDDRGTIATLGTAVVGARDVEVGLLDGPRVPARVLGVDDRLNVGILEAKAERLDPVAVAPAGSTRVGAFAVAIGNPFGLTGSVGTGIVSGIEREVQGLTMVRGRPRSVLYYDLVQTTAPINPGDSGGLLADSRGRMIGMLSSTFGRAPSAERIRAMIREVVRTVDLDQVRGFLDALDLKPEQKALLEGFLNRVEAFKAQGDGNEDPPIFYEATPSVLSGAALGAQGINFALPADQVLYAARMIREHGRVVRLGVRAAVLEAALASQLGLERGEGLLVEEVVEDSPADRAGIRVHDVLLTLGGQPLGRPRDLRRALVRSPVKDPFAVEVLSRGERATRTVVMK